MELSVLVLKIPKEMHNLDTDIPTAAYKELNPKTGQGIHYVVLSKWSTVVGHYFLKQNQKF